MDTEPPQCIQATPPRQNRIVDRLLAVERSSERLGPFRDSSGSHHPLHKVRATAKRNVNNQRYA
jgi:hypothetical protein